MGGAPGKAAGVTVRQLRLPDEREIALDLRVDPHQEDWVPPVDLSLALVDRHPDSEPWLFLHNDTPIGFCAVTHGNDSSSIGGFLVAREYQGKGYGRAALELVVEAIFGRRAKVNEILLTVREGNDAARRLYERFGFVATARWHRGERIYALSREEWSRSSSQRSS